MADERPAAEVAEPFESLSALRAEHVDMMRTARRDSHDAEFVGRIRKFIDRVKATGTLIDSPADRDAAQNIITYWTSSLFTAADAAALSAAPPTGRSAPHHRELCGNRWAQVRRRDC
jgi:hypothetical protein